MSPRTKEVRFSDEMAMKPSSIQRAVIREKFRPNAKPKRTVPPPPPPPPPAVVRMKSTTPPPPPLRRLKATPPPPPPPPPPPKKPTEKLLLSNTNTPRTPARSQPKKSGTVLTKDKDCYFSTFTSNCSNGNIDPRNSDVFLAQPALTIVSPLSGITNTTGFNSPSTQNYSTIGLDTTLTTLNTIDMLNFDYIESCSCLPDLQRLICILNGSKKESTPRLLEAAKKRYCDIGESNNDHMGVSDNMTPGKNDGLAQSVANISQITTGNTTLESIDPAKSSLNFSISPSSTTLHGLNLLESPKVSDSCLFVGSMGREREGSDRRLRSIEESPVALKQHRTSPASRIIHNASKREVMGNGQKQRKERSRQDIPPSQAPVDTKEIQKLQESLNKVTKEREETQKSLYMTRAIICKKDEETRALEARLEVRIIELSRVLAATAERSTLVVEGERTYRKQCEEELKKENQENAHLNKELTETHNNLLSLQRRHSSFRVALLKATGITNTERRNLSEQEFVSSLSKKIKTMKEENDMMAQTLKQSKKAIQERNVMEIRMNDTLRIKKKLKTENQKLCKTIQELRAEVKSSRAYIDKLLKISHETKEEDWEKQEQQYKQVIQNLRQQIRKQDTVVSISLYKDEKNKANEKVAQLRDAVNTINNLNAQVEELQQKEKMHTKTKGQTFATTKMRTTNQKGPNNNSDQNGPQTPKMMSHEDRLIGSTISFNNSPVSNSIACNGLKSPRSGERFRRQLGVKQTNVAKKQPVKGPKNENKKSSVLGEILTTGNESNCMRQLNCTSNVFSSLGKENSKTTNSSSLLKGSNNGQSLDQTKELNDNYFFQQYGIDNPKTPNNSYSRLRRFGDREAVQKKIKKLRSPKISSRLQVIVH